MGSWAAWLLSLWPYRVRVVSGQKLGGLISAIPANTHICDTEKKMVEINVLCVYKKLCPQREALVLPNL